MRNFLTDWKEQKNRWDLPGRREKQHEIPVDTLQKKNHSDPDSGGRNSDCPFSRICFQENHRRFSERKAGVDRNASEKAEQRRAQALTITEAQREEGIERARKVFPERIAYFAKQMGVTYGRVTLREQKTRWGSCSSKGNLNFNWKLILLPLELLDYVVVHELAHRKEMNHSAAFWKVVEEVLPDYRERRKALKEIS
ncbi:metal-dependent hydrolase [Firmicutes bacterium CAG:646]|nr:metal-dependent hydrolase [Firmicutes bacterium CAG:646]